MGFATSRPFDSVASSVTYSRPVAQMEEHSATNREVGGSSPSGPANSRSAEFAYVVIANKAAQIDVDQNARVSGDRGLKINGSETSTGQLILIFGLLAQLVEHLAFNQGVTGSIPVQPTKFSMVARG